MEIELPESYFLVISIKMQFESLQTVKQTSYIYDENSACQEKSCWPKTN